MEVLLNTCINTFDIIFVQEPPWRLIRTAPSASNKEGEDVIGAPNHPAWQAMVRKPDLGSRPRVMAYVSTRLAHMRPAYRRDLVDHHNIFILSLFIEG